MSRIGKRPIKLVQDVKVSFNNQVLEVKGPKGELELQTHSDVDLVIDNETKIIFWDGKGTNGEEISSGTYFFQIKNKNHSEVRKVSFLKYKAHLFF